VTHESGTLEPEGVRTMFDRIAPFYDVMNHVMTVGLDRRWRRHTVEAVVQPGARVLDACCGTGDLAIAAEREGGIVTGLDFSGEMLVRVNVAEPDGALLKPGLNAKVLISKLSLFAVGSGCEAVCEGAAIGG